MPWAEFAREYAGDGVEPALRAAVDSFKFVPKSEIVSPHSPASGQETLMPPPKRVRATIGCIMHPANKSPVPTGKGEAPLLAAQRRP